LALRCGAANGEDGTALAIERDVLGDGVEEMA
jgi:hypothetical protein